MGVSESPNIVQEFMENLLWDLLEEIVIHIDDILVTNHSWSSHLHLLDHVLAHLDDAGFSVYPLSANGLLRKWISFDIG